MSSDASATRARITARFDELEVAASLSEIHKLTDYLCLLAKWNSRINLTALAVADPSDSAIDRLLVEPIAASRHVLASDDLAVDLGSGGGSPGFPLKIGAPQLRMLLVESRERKCAFLREVVRSLGLSGVEVANTRFEALPELPALSGQASLVSFRAVRADHSLWSTVSRLLMADGRAFWFGAPEHADGQAVDELPKELVPVSSHILVPMDSHTGSSRLVVLKKTKS